LHAFWHGIGGDMGDYHLPNLMDAQTSPAAGHTTTYRGFLFSDVRNFTTFAERHGNAAAAALVGRFLEIARAAIARHDGAELKTEGDNIHAVFPAASGAVLCGLEIVEGAAELNAREPEHELGLGVGIHAGEAVETAEGYIGRAVNIAARLCAVAKPGEVLVSSTVKGITQASINVGFIPRGKRRLKGIQDPILVYAVTRDPNPTVPRALPRRAVLGAAGGVAAVVALVTIVALGSSLLPRIAKETSGPSVGPSLSAAPTAQPLAMGPLPIGTYVSRAFQPPFSFVIEDLDWTASRDQPGTLALVRDAAPLGSIYFARVQEVIMNPCAEGGEGTTGPAGRVIPQLRALGHVTLSDETLAHAARSRARRST
jgi:class 3 adenylate cyclase